MYPRQLVLQIPLLAALLITITVVIYTWIAASNQLAVTKHNVQVMGDTLSKNIAAASVDYMLTDDFASLEQLLLQAADFPGIQRIQVCDEKGNLLSDVMRVDGGKPQAQFGREKLIVPVQNTAFMQLNETSMVHWHPVNIGGILGWVRTEQSLDELHIIVRQLWFDSLFTGLIGILLSASLMFFYLKKPMHAIKKASAFAMRLDKTQGYQIAIDDSSFEIQQLEKSLNSASRRLYDANKSLSDQKFALDQSSIVCIADINRLITYANDKFCQISDYPRNELMGLNQYFLCFEFYPENFFDELWAQATQGKVWRGEVKNRKRNGGIFWVDATVVPFLDENNRPYQFVSIQTDITEKKLVEEKLQQNEFRMRSILENTGDGIVTLDETGNILSFNRAAENILGHDSDDVIGASFSTMITDAENNSGDAITLSWFRELDKTNKSVNLELVGLAKNSETIPLELTVSKMKETDNNLFIVVLRDITERLRAEEHLRHLAHHDSLTGLPNRNAFLDRMDHAIALTQRRKNDIAVLFMDIDRFKYINDTLGHDVGDRLLQVIAERLKLCMRKGDTVARLGGDEFTFLLEDLASSNDIPGIAEKIIDTVAKPIIVGDRELFITASIGVSRFPEDGKSGLELLKNADTAMYRAKDEGRNNFQFYSMDMGRLAHERLSMETYLRQALKFNEFFLDYQPQFDIRTGKVLSLEALIRWNHPKEGLVNPSQFIPVLEETGLIVVVGEWILKTACQQIVTWEAAGINCVPVFVNLSARQFKEKNLVASIQQILADSNLPAQKLGIEITESILMQYSDVSSEMLSSFSEIGIGMALDDFGTGYSSLSYLRRFPIDTLKIDRSFIHKIDRDQGNSEIVKAIIALGQSLNLNVIAEGVETKEELALLRKWGCEIAQGYLFSRPLSADKIFELLRQDDELLKLAAVSGKPTNAV